MQIRKYKKEDEDKVIKMVELEGEEWKSYYAPKNVERFKKALEKSITYVAYEGEELCGYSRSVDDNACEIIVCDLLVAPKHRGKNVGSQLMECIYNDYPVEDVYLLAQFRKVKCQ